MNTKTIFACALVALASCSTTNNGVEPFATTRVAADRDKFALRRVGVLPVDGNGMRAEDVLAFQGALTVRLAEHLHAEVVPLTNADVSEVPDNASFRTGRIQPEFILALSRRFNLDGLVATTVTERRTYAPQRFGVEVELTACDTGLPIWGVSLRLDAAQERTQRSLQTWCENERGANPANQAWDLYLLSPQLFAEFAAAQVGMAY